MSETRVRLAAVTKRYGGLCAVDSVDLAVAAGEYVALVGHNGAGKSTLMKLILGLVAPDAGSLAVLGAAGAGRGRTEIGYLPESLALYPSLTGEETLAFYARLKREPRARNAALLERVGLGEAARRKVATYSKGMRQRLGLAQALLGRPRLLLLDEPTTGLDPFLRQRFYEIIAELRADGAGILISSHALAELETQVDRVVIMNRGRKVADGTVGALRRQAARPVRIRLTLADDARAAVPLLPRVGAGWQRVAPAIVEARCGEAEKMAALESLCRVLGHLADIEILSPTLDDTYAHFLDREEAAE